METMTILLPTIADIKAFVKESTLFKGKTVFKLASTEIDAKSLMGVLSMDLSEPHELSFENIDNAKEYARSIQRFAVA